MAVKRNKKLVIWQASNYTCTYCGRVIFDFYEEAIVPPPPDVATVDHAIPKSKGGTDSFENLVSSCFSCNYALQSLLFDGEIEQVIHSKKKYLSKCMKVKCHFCTKVIYAKNAFLEWNGHWACAHCHFVVLGYKVTRIKKWIRNANNQGSSNPG